MLTPLPSFTAPAKADNPAALPQRSPGQPLNPAFAMLVRQQSEQQLSALRTADQQALAARVSAAASLMPRLAPGGLAGAPSPAAAGNAVAASAPPPAGRTAPPTASAAASAHTAPAPNAGTDAASTPVASARASTPPRPKPAPAAKPEQPRPTPAQAGSAGAANSKAATAVAEAVDADEAVDAVEVVNAATLSVNPTAIPSLAAAGAVLPAPDQPLAQPAGSGSLPGHDAAIETLAAALPADSTASATAGQDGLPTGLDRGRVGMPQGPAADRVAAGVRPDPPGDTPANARAVAPGTTPTQAQAAASGSTPASALAPVNPPGRTRPDASNQAERQVGEALRQRALARPAPSADDAAALSAWGHLPGAPRSADAMPAAWPEPARGAALAFDARSPMAAPADPLASATPIAMGGQSSVAPGPADAPAANSVLAADPAAAAAAWQAVSGGAGAAPANASMQASLQASTHASTHADRHASLHAETRADTPAAAGAPAAAPVVFDSLLQGALAAGGSLRGTAGPAGAAGSAPGTTALAGQIDTPVDSPMFASALGAQVSLLARDGVSSALLQLHPLDMGPISVQIVLDGNAARVDFQALNAETRGAIEASLPALAGALQDAGLTLAGGGVFDQAPGRQPHGQAALGSAGPAQRQGGADDSASVTPAGQAARRAAPRGLVDLVA